MTYQDTMATPPSALKSRKRPSPTTRPLPESVAWLNDLKLEMAAVSSSKSGRIEYELRVRCQAKASEGTSWSVRRTFDQYRAFQKSLLHKLQPGHSCTAECRWLHSVVKKHFPRRTLLGSRCTTLVEQRRMALLRLLTTVQASIVNFGNHSCNVLLNDVSQEFAAFVVGSTKSFGATSTPATPSSDSELDTRDSLASFGSATSDEDDGGVQYIHFDDDAEASWVYGEGDC
ncbi:hypothetical protein BBJ28_00010059 [Nothophytophthora sp. Chile5]|nr:hypothetical protein BBJ28_00010059 [Nothophytophthora sp. Chile5]